MDRRTAIRSLSIGFGYTMSVASMTTFITGCKSDSSMAKAWAPSFFKESEANAINMILDKMLPTSDSSPGYKDLGLIKVADTIIDQVYNAEDKDRFKMGLGYIMDQLGATKNDKGDYGSVSDEQVSSFMDNFMSKPSEEAEAALKPKMDADFETLSESDKSLVGCHKAVSTLRRLGLSTYFASEKIGTEVMNYDPVPGDYNGCIPVADVGRNWSLR